MEADISEKVAGPAASSGAGLRSAVHPAIHGPREGSIHIDGPLFDREGHEVSSGAEFELDETPRERAMRLHPAGKAALFGRSRVGMAKPDSSASNGAPTSEHSGGRATSVVVPGLTIVEDSPRDAAKLRSPSSSDRSETAESFSTGPRPDDSSALRSKTCMGSHRVRAGDTLWSIAAAVLETEDMRRIARYWPKIHRRNLDVVGSNPDLIYPGQVLELPLECND